jgi:CRISPR-associated endonuclease/helicase Cas3
MAGPATEKSAKQYLAHVREHEDGSFEIHDLEDHLRAVAKGTEAFAKGFGGDEWGHLAGLWHDLGKYSHLFQSYISHKSGYDPEAHNRK